MKMKMKNINRKNIYNETPLHILCDGTLNENMIKLLIDNGASLNALDENDRTPFHVLCLNDNITFNILKYFIFIYKNININPDKDKWNIIHYLFSNKNITEDMIKLVIEEGFDLECLTNDNDTPINILCGNSKATLNMIKLLIDKNVSIEHNNCYNWKPIHYACLNGNKDIIKYIIDISTDLEIKANNSLSPLYFILKLNDDELLYYIIDKGVSYEYIDKIHIDKIETYLYNKKCLIKYINFK